MSDSPNEFSGARVALIAACEEMDGLLNGLVDSKGRIVDEIHQVRKAGKRLRGALTIIGEPKPCVRWLAVIGKMLGESRDATVRVQVWRDLGFDQPGPNSVEAVIASVLALEADAARRCPTREVVEWARSAVTQLKNRLEARSDEEIAEDAEVGADKLYRQLRKRLKRTYQRSRDADFQECRKVIIEWTGGMSLIAPNLELPGEDEAARLSENLGEESDLEVLAQWMTKRGFSSAIAGAAWKVLRKRQEKVRRLSMSLIRKELSPVFKLKL